MDSFSRQQDALQVRSRDFGRSGCRKRSLGTRKPNTKHQPDMKQRTSFSAHHGRECSKTYGILPFSDNEFQCPKPHRPKPDMKQHGKHHTIRSSPNMKPQTQRETTAYPSFISLGSTISPDRKQPQHETTSSLAGFPAATAVEIGSQGCPCRVQQYCCYVWGLVS